MNRRMNDIIKINLRDAALYQECAEDIMQYNLQTLCGISLLGAMGGLVLSLLALPPLRVLKLLPAYLSIAVVFGLFYVLGRTLLQKYPRRALAAYYLLFTVIGAIAIYMGTALSLAANATTFVVLEIVLPLLIIDKPSHLHVFFAAICAAFCVTSAMMKAPDIARLDITNCVSFYFISAFLCRQAIRTKLRDMLMRRELQRQRDMDALTQLDNRSAFERHIAQYLQGDKGGAVMLIMDVDNFKNINDTLGHTGGDNALQKISDALRSTFRKSDYVSRLGGDEFVAFLPAVSSMEAVTGKITDMICTIQQISLEDTAQHPVSVSVGLAAYPQDGRTFDELYKKADVALYCAKRRGKGQYAIYDAAMDTPEAQQAVAEQEAALAAQEEK